MVKDFLRKRGGHNLGGLRVKFQHMDDNGDNKLSKEDIKQGFADIGLYLTQ